MEITEFSNKYFEVPLKKELWKKVDEQWAQLILSCYDKKYKSLQCLDKPDLQNVDKSLAIEVVNTKSKKDGYNDGNFSDYIDPRSSDAKRNKSLKNLKNSGIDIPYPGVMVKTSPNIEERIQNIINAYEKKIAKIEKYKMLGFEKLGVFMLDERPLDILYFDRVANVLKGAFKDKDFDIIFLCFANKLIVFNSQKMLTDIFKINEDYYNALGIEARIIVERSSL